MTWNMDDPRWTAYVLGEVSDAEREELESVLATSPEACAYVVSLREAVGAIQRELTVQPPAPLDDLQRRRIQQAAVARPRRRWLLGGGLAAAAASVSAMFLVTGRSRQDAMTMDSVPRLASVGQDQLERAQVAQEQTMHGEYMVGRATPNALGVVGFVDPSGAVRVVDDHDGIVAASTEAYSRIDDNPFFHTQRDPLSTFSVDVDTASYANVRRYISGGALPPRDAVRIEELINYFSYDYPPPNRGEPFSITTEVGPAPWDPSHRLVRIGLQTAPIDEAQVPPRNLVFLIDTSGSMQSPDKLPLVVESLGMLVESLRPQDRVAIAVYAGAAGLVLDSTSDRGEIRDALRRLAAGGSTNGGAGIQLAYDVATRHLIRNGINRVILCSDGDMNVGVTSEGDLTRLIESERDRGVFLSVLGFGMGNLKDATMEKLADRGNGNYAYIDSLLEAHKVLVRQAGATLVTVAKDVKLQVELNPTTVAGYRLIGYENRVLRAQDFKDDRKDAGDVGAGHAVTALYEIIPAGVEVPGTKTDELKYQTKGAPAGAADELLTLNVRYKAPDGDTSKLLSRVVKTASAHDAIAGTSIDYRWAVAIAGFGMMLRESPYRGNLSWPQVQSLAEGALGKDVGSYRKQALALIGQASKLRSTMP